MREVEENVKSAVSSNLASRDLEFRNSILEQQEIIIRTMMKLAYEKEIVLRDMEET
jgi:BMFP domain-containing protein YqiC